MTSCITLARVTRVGSHHCVVRRGVQHIVRTRPQHIIGPPSILLLRSGLVGDVLYYSSLRSAVGSPDSTQYVEEFVLPKIVSAEDFETERAWVKAQISTWLDEEWTPLPIHTSLGQAAGDAYCKLRAQGQDEVGSILLGMSSELMGFNYRDTFTSSFEVSNKVVELIMMRSGGEVCCTSPADKERLDRVDCLLRESTSKA